MHYLQAEDGQAVRILLVFFSDVSSFQKKKRNNMASTFSNAFFK